jgi:thiamine pyrophosphate-dependent acetolactate synthase large subunit-like protein
MTMTAPVNGGTAIALQMVHAGIETFFGVMGDGNVDVIAGTIGTGTTRYIAARHEQGAVSMAEGYARSTGRIGVATVTYGPGVGNTVTAMTSAARHGTHILLISGHRTSRHGPPQFHDPDKMLGPTDVTVLRVDDAADLPGCVARALALVVQTNGPVALSVADILLEGPADPDTLPLRQDPPDRNPPPDVNPERLQAMAKILADAKRPLILAGRGAQGAGDTILALADRIGAAMLTSLLGHGLFGDHSAALGISGGLAGSAGRHADQNADVVLVLGASLTGWTCDGGQAFADAKILHVDSDPSAFQRAYMSTHMQVQGDAKDVAAQLLYLIAPRTDTAPNTCWWQDGEAPEPDLPLMLSGGLSPRALCRRLDAALPANRAMALDGGHFFEAMCREIRVADDQAFCWTLGFGSVGLGLATAIGAAVGRPDRLTIAGIGDGGLLMSLGELETVARYHLPVLIVVMNDASYGAEEKLLEHKGLDPATARFPRTDFAAIAQALDIPAAVLKTGEDVEALLPQLADLHGPFLIDARIDQSETAEFVALLHRLKATPA